MSHYYAENMFNPVLVSPTFKVEGSTLQTKEVEVYVVSELFEEMKSVSLEISVQRFDTIDDTHVQKVLIGKLLSQKLLLNTYIVHSFNIIILF